MTTRVGIREVAKAAGVSVTTVSHALNDATSSRVKAETQQHVRDVARNLGYAPNRLASGLRNQRSQILGLVSDEITTTPFAGAMIRGAQDAAYERGYVVMVVNSGLDSELEHREITMLQQHQVDGVVYARMYHQKARLPTELAGLPTVLLDAVTEDGSISSVVPDEVGAAENAVDALIRAGHTRIGMINNEDDIPATHGRRTGFLNALRRHGLEHDPRHFVIGTAHTQGGREAALDLFGQPDRPTALFCFSDRVAMGAYQAAMALGLRIPEDVSIVGFDNLEIIADALWPGLTTVALPHYDMGRWAVDRILDDIENPGTPAVQTQLACPLIERGSVGPPPA
ncbi:LacI family DNA-binding transcriptional regulator [Arthrobacter globiformis]|uniref:LacI family DNA-binding transcriptional regulator n=1 Tax=Arthrobacter globiformis TaxID=1665 RepID=UPI002783E128|nr:LacI family DNA-binding transcriptional regulator [Arthrobacter globiformis]MDQ0867146.1 LacI family transcriptional regulator [Arthrobacter globiformis]